MSADFAPGDTFLAAGAPWFFTLFGRDSLWAARMLLPLGTDLAAGTLRVLAARQGTVTDVDSAEQPGKILHEVRAKPLSLGEEGRVLPPVYYGTVDATPLWVCLLHDAWRWGMPADQVEALLPAMERALAWMTDHGDADGDGFLEYVDEGGHGLANQGWKDSGDSVQWRDGTLATGPIALCEVQAYAHEAALGGAALLEAFGRPGADRWRAWAAELATRFRAAFWVQDATGRYPAIALDADKRAVDTVTSNIGHLLGTGLLDARRGAGGRRAARRRRHELGVRAADHVDDVRRVLAAALPRRVGVGARHRDRGDRPGPQRAHRGGRPARRGAARRGRGDRVPAARAVLRRRPRGGAHARALPRGVPAAGVVGGGGGRGAVRGARARRRRAGRDAAGVPGGAVAGRRGARGGAAASPAGRSSSTSTPAARCVRGGGTADVRVVAARRRPPRARGRLPRRRAGRSGPASGPVRTTVRGRTRRPRAI